MNMSIQDTFTINATGTFTPGPAPCGNGDCRWSELTVIHAAGCEGQDDDGSSKENN